MTLPIQKVEQTEFYSVQPPEGAEVAVPDVTDFEKGLFADGVYTFDPETETAQAEGEVVDKLQWYKGNPYWDEERTHNSLQYDIQSKRWEIAWKQHFSGRIPKSWDFWDAPRVAMEEAGKRGIQLSQVLIDAGISHDHHLVANRTGTHQVLNMHQLAIAFARPLPKWNRDEIVEAQIAKGMTREQVEKARKLGEEIRKRMSEGTIELDSTTPATTPQKTPELSAEHTVKPKRRHRGFLKGVISK